MLRKAAVSVLIEAVSEPKGRRRPSKRCNSLAFTGCLGCLMTGVFCAHTASLDKFSTKDREEAKGGISCLSA